VLLLGNQPFRYGLRIFIRAKLPPKDRKIGHFECYESGRYLTVTGNHLEGTPTTIEHRQAEMEAVHTEMFAERNRPRSNGKASTASVPPDLEDGELLGRAFRAKNGEAIWRLFHGDISQYGSHSEPDLALCGHLGFYTGPDPGKLDRLFRSSDLCRPKWDEPRRDSTYGRITIDRALSGNREYYDSSRNGNGSHSGKGSSSDADEEARLHITCVADVLSEKVTPCGPSAYSKESWQ
jgi:putative DNA primase/helicase